MLLSRLIFRAVTAWFSILVGNICILSLIGVSAISAVSSSISPGIADLRLEALSVIIIAWGVLLESRDLITNNGHSGKQDQCPMDPSINHEVERCGIFLVIMGLFLEMVTYFDEDAHAEMLPGAFHVAASYLEWILVVLIVLELAASCFTILKIRSSKELNAWSKTKLGTHPAAAAEHFTTSSKRLI